MKTRRIPRLAQIAALLATLSCSNAWSADFEPIATDRPDFVESSLVVGAGVFQLETSLAYDRHKESSSRMSAWTSPTLMRLGVSEVLEIRMETDGLVRQSVTESGVSSKERGFADVSVGIKWHISDESNDGVPSTALLLHADLDSGSRAFRRNGIAPSARLVAEWSLPADMSLGVMGGVVFDKDEFGQKFRSGILAATVGKPFSEKWRGFAELAGRSLTKGKYGGNEVTLDLGTAYAIDDDTQLDAAVALGLNKSTTDSSWTIGFSRRFR